MRSILIGAFTAVLAFVGCGGGSSSLTRTEFAQKANAYCREAAEERSKALASALRAHQGQPSGRDTELKVAEEVLLPPLQKLVAQLEGLDEPTDGRGELEHVVAAFKSGLEKAEASPSNLLDSNTFSPARHRSKAAGLTECNQF